MQDLDPLDHPDLKWVSHRLREQLDRVLEAEQAAAAASALRHSTLRDQLIERQDRRESVTVFCSNGSRRSGTVTGVGQDYVVLDCDGLQIMVPLRQVTLIEQPDRL
jgi:sRNA-binding regulator protein Hfq